MSKKTRPNSSKGPAPKETAPRPLHPSRVFQQLESAERAVAGLHDAVRTGLEARLRALGRIEPKDLGEGKAISQRINALLGKLGLRFKFPGKDIPATLGFLVSLHSKPGDFFLRATSREAVSLRGDFSAIELIAARPRQARSGKKPPLKKRR